MASRRGWRKQQQQQHQANSKEDTSVSPLHQQETVSMEGAASNLSEVYYEEQQLWKLIMDIVRKIPTFPRILRHTSEAA